MNELYFDVETTPVRHDERLPTPVICAYAVGQDEVQLASPVTMAELVKRHNGPVVGHNVAFDLAVLGLDAPRLLRDTSILATLEGAATSDPAAANTSLKRLAKKQGIELEGKGTIQLSFRPGMTLSEEQREYVKQDVVATRAVFRHLGQGEYSDEQRQVAFSLSIFHMAREGVRVDVQRIRKHLSSLEASLLDRRAVLCDAGLIQPRGPKREPWKREAVDHLLVQERLRAAGVTKTTPTGELAADEDTLLATKDATLIDLVAYNKARKERSMWGAFDTGEGDVVRARWKSLVLTGRISCSAPNLTNIPQRGGLRECLMPREGKVLVVADYPTLEMRTWAYACLQWLGRSTLIELWRQGKDPHWQTAASILGVSYDAAMLHPRGADTRQIAKALNFGLPGGMGSARLREHLRSHGFEVGPYAAHRLRQAWFRAYPEAKAYFAYIKAHAEGDKFRISLPDAGHERLAYYSEACNFPFQGLGAAVSKSAVARSQKAGVPPSALVHDELLAECPPGQAREVGEEITRQMRLAGEERCPGVPWDGITYKIYTERWASKG